MLTLTEDKFISVINEMCSCTDCELHLTRTLVVPYRGDPRTDVMVVGEAPGYEEDRQGLAMVGRTGSYLVEIMSAAGLPVEKIYITNCLMCRPPDNSDPLSSQLEACAKWLNKHIEMVNPKVIIAVGRYACSRLIPEIMHKTQRMNNIEGKQFKSMYHDGRIIIPLRHPSAILRQPTSKTLYEEIVTKIVDTILADILHT